MNWMPMREFLRGGYREITEPTVISSHGRPQFTVFPHTSTTVNYASPTVTGTMTSDPPTYTTRTTVRSDLPAEDDL